MTRDQVRYLVRRGAWRRRYPGVFVSADVPRTVTQDLWLASLYAGPSALLSHTSARFVWEVGGAVGAAPEVRIPRGRNLRAHGIVVHRTVGLVRVAARTVQGLRVTAPEPTVLDAAGQVADVDELAWIVEQLRSRRLLTLASLARALDRAGTAGRRGSARVREAVESLDVAGCESLLEVKVARLLRRSGLPPAERQVVVVAGGEEHRLDFAWPWRRVALECDGRRFHSDPAAFRRDRGRWSAIAAALGYRFLFVTWRDVVERPRWIVERVAGALAA